MLLMLDMRVEVCMRKPTTVLVLASGSLGYYYSTLATYTGYAYRGSDITKGLLYAEKPTWQDHPRTRKVTKVS